MKREKALAILVLVLLVLNIYQYITAVINSLVQKEVDERLVFLFREYMDFMAAGEYDMN